MKTLAESIFNTDKDLKFSELVDLDIKIDKLKASDRYTIKAWIESHTNIKHYLTAPNWKVLINLGGNGFCVCKDIWCQYKGEKKASIHYSECFLQVFYDEQKEAIMFIAQNKKKQNIPFDCIHEWNIIKDIVNAFSAIPYRDNGTLYANRWILSVKP